MQIVKKEFPANSQGFWRMVYADEGLRILVTNQGNHFALVNPDATGTAYTGWSRFDKSKFQ